MQRLGAHEAARRTRGAHRQAEKGPHRVSGTPAVLGSPHPREPAPQVAARQTSPKPVGADRAPHAEGGGARQGQDPHRGRMRGLPDGDRPHRDEHRPPARRIGKPHPQDQGRRAPRKEVRRDHKPTGRGMRPRLHADGPSGGLHRRQVVRGVHSATGRRPRPDRTSGGVLARRAHIRVPVALGGAAPPEPAPHAPRGLQALREGLGVALPLPAPAVRHRHERGVAPGRRRHGDREDLRGPRCGRDGHTTRRGHRALLRPDGRLRLHGVPWRKDAAPSGLRRGPRARDHG